MQLLSSMSFAGFAPAWAEDSQGNQLPTHYEWADGTLIQHIDLSDPTIEFPVLADPYWGYSVSFSIGNTTPWQAWSALHGCFNCYFPIYGAPTAFPAMYQVLPLRVGWGGTPLSLDFTCIMGYSAWSAPDNAAGWMFNAASSHVDGLGSWIAFDLVAYQLQVTAWIVNDFGPGGIGNNAYAAGAALTWQQFANNLTT